MKNFLSGNDFLIYIAAFFKKKTTPQVCMSTHPHTSGSLAHCAQPAWQFKGVKDKRVPLLD